MPEAKKISELPAFSTVQAGDILPIVDESLTQTGKCTAAQVAAIGGGPPGVNTVSNQHVRDSGLQARKLGFLSADRIAYSTSTTDTVEGATRFRCSETALTSWARGLLSVSDAAGGRAYLEALQSTANPSFTGQVRFEGRTALDPSIVRNDSLTSGIFFPQPETVAMSINGVERWRLQGDGFVWTPLHEYPSIQRPTFAARAFVVFNGASYGSQNFSIVANQRGIAQRYGLVGTIADTSNSRSRITAIENARGINVSYPDSPNFNDSYGKGTFPRRNLGTETRANYTSPQDNKHWNWNGTDWVEISANNQPWLGTINYAAQSTGNGILSYGNVASVVRQSTGTYRCFFSHHMPPIETANASSLEQYGAIVTMNRIGFCWINGFTSEYVEIRCTDTSSGSVDPTCITVAVLR